MIWMGFLYVWVYNLQDFFSSFVFEGDINHDGYPDLLILTSQKSNPSKTFLRILLYSPNEDKYTFMSPLITKELDALDARIVSASFIDLDDDGALDLVVSGVQDGEEWTWFFYNWSGVDAFFLKSMGKVLFCKLLFNFMV